MPIHVAGSLKQKNKAFKSKHATKGELKRRNNKGGRTETKRGSSKGGSSKQEIKASRKARARQSAKQLKDEVMWSKAIGNKGEPRVVSLVAMTDAAMDSIQTLLHHLETEVSDVYIQPGYGAGPTHLVSLTYKTRLCIQVVPREINATVDLVRASHVVVLVGKAIKVSNRLGDDMPLVDDLGLDMMNLIKAVGLSSALTVVDTSEVEPVIGHAAAKAWGAFMEYHIPEYTRVIPYHPEPNHVSCVRQFVRFVSEMRIKRIGANICRPYIIGKHVNYLAASQQLEVVGYIHGDDLSANDMVHIRDVGDHRLSEISIVSDPCDFTLVKRQEAYEVHTEVVDRFNRDAYYDKSDPYVSDGEETTDYSDMDMEEISDQDEGGIHPKEENMQADWDVGIQDEEEDGDEEEEEWRKEALKKLNKKEGEESEEESEDMRDIGEEEMRCAAALRKEYEDNIQWPDEVEVKRGSKFKEKYEGFRGIQNWRHTTWNEKMDLPKPYSKILQIEQMKKFQEEMIAERQGVAVGSYVKVVVEKVPAEVAARFQGPLILRGLYPYEHAMSVVNVLVKRHMEFDGVVPNHRRVLVDVGGRRMVVRPVFSQNNMRADKQKMERFMPQSEMFVMSFYAPITYAPATVLVFELEEEVSQGGGELGYQPPQLIAVGTVLNVDPSRLILERVVLTGIPCKIHKKTAVIRDMFYDPDDVEWFKPVELYTKLGLTGNIKDAVGVHGRFKAFFSNRVLAHDTVCMNLYKRAFPLFDETHYLSRFPAQSLDAAAPSAQMDF